MQFNRFRWTIVYPIDIDQVEGGQEDDQRLGNYTHPPLLTLTNPISIILDSRTLLSAALSHDQLTIHFFATY